MIDETHYILAPAMHGQIPEARPCTLVTVVYRDGTPRLWPIKFPKEGEHDNEAWITARAAAKAAIEKWVKLVWVRRAYMTRDALPGYAPDPDFSKLPPFNELVQLASASTASSATKRTRSTASCSACRRKRRTMPMRRRSLIGEAAVPGNLVRRLRILSRTGSRERRQRGRSGNAALPRRA